VFHYLKGFIVVILLAGVLSLGWWKYRDRLTTGLRPSEGMTKLSEMEAGGVPDFTLGDLQGASVRLSDFKDRIVILSFWASWCDPCVAEFPSMIKLVNTFKGGEVVLVAVSADHSKEDIESFLRPYGDRLGPNVKILWDSDMSLAQRYGTEVLPESYILGPGLKIIRKVSGSEDWSAPGAMAFFKQLVAEAAGK
jgi:thiol-disulfide isomerase/thioredoxin